jgi:hypothetical protein
MRMRKKATAAALALCTVATLGATVPVAPAGADSNGNGFQYARFKVEVKGYQDTIHKRTHEAESACDISDFSSGRERLSFRSIKPVVFLASHMRGEPSPQFFAAGRQLGLPTTAKVQRSYTPAVSRAAAACEDNGGADSGYQPTPPDCGTKTVKPWSLNLQYSRTKENGLLLSAGGGEDPFEHCQGTMPMFPTLLLEGSGYKGDYITADLSMDELFDPEFEQWISIAEGSAKNSGDDWWTQTKVHWEVSFTRLKDKAPGSTDSKGARG